MAIIAAKGFWDVTAFVKNSSTVERTEQLRINQVRYTLHDDTATLTILIIGY